MKPKNRTVIIAASPDKGLGIRKQCMRFFYLQHNNLAKSSYGLIRQIALDLTK
jgi:hypothetical protein